MAVLYFLSCVIASVISYKVLKKLKKLKKEVEEETE